MTTSVSGFFLLPLLLAALAAVSSTAGGTVIRMQVSHGGAGRGLSRHELLRRMAQRSSSRAARLLAGTSASAPVTPGQLNGSDPSPSAEYLVHMAIGTPPQPVQLTLGTGSDLIWTQCQPCTSCFPQALPYLDPSGSSTFQQLACDSPACLDPLLTSTTCVNQTACAYGYSYVDKSTTNGMLVADTFVFDDQGQTTAVPNLTFGCGRNNSGTFTSNETGIAGFGRGNLSLPSQLKVDNFSYCFTNITGSTPSPVLLGLPADLASSGGAAVQTTPFIQNPSSNYYYLNLTSIKVGSTTLQVPASAFALNADGSGGTIIDSGTSYTSLPPDVYSLLSSAFASELNMEAVNNVTSLPGYTCFPASTTTTTLPPLELQFDGATLDLPQENYVLPVDDENGESYMCIAIRPSGGDMTIIGNYQQQNLYVIYDLAGDTLSFVSAQCDMV